MAEAAQDLHWMRLALAEARAAGEAGEMPVGAVVVCRGNIVATGRNGPISTHDPTAHAEIVALRAAARQLGNYRLTDCDLFVTLEPCSMCAGAILQARVKRVVFGAANEKGGAAGSVIDLFAHRQLNHQTKIQGGVLADACADGLLGFFRLQRVSKRLERAVAGSALRDDALRTPESRFAALPDWPTASCYVNDLPDLAGLRLHYLETGPVNASQTVVCLHGPQDWCYAWRSSIIRGQGEGVRLVCPDLIGFGKSDKPKRASFHSLQWHAQVLLQWMSQLRLCNLTLIAPVQMHELVQLVVAGFAPQVIRTRYSQPDMLDAAALAAPFPDVGHQAALRAFATMLACTASPTMPSAPLF